MENTSPRQTIYNILALFALLGALALFFRVFDLGDVRARIEEAGIWGPLILIAAKASTIVIAPLSGSPLYPVAGALFGFWKGFFFLVLGDMLGGTIAFVLSRLFGRRIVDRFLSGQQNLVTKALEMMGSPRGFLLARLGFVTFPEVPAYAAGLSTIRYLPFIGIFTLVGMLPTAVTAGLGAFLTQENNSLVFGGVLLLGGVVSATSIYLFMRLMASRVDSDTSAGERQ